MTATHECGVCWRAYDPDLGDEAGGVAPGTPFATLPNSWCCPTCDASKARFLPLTEDGAPRSAMLHRSLEAAYRRVEQTMAGLPLLNRRLTVEVTELRPWSGYFAAGVVTPWSVNLVLLPRDPFPELPQPGAERDIDLPSGTYEFLAATLPETGSFWQLSLFSPPTEFDGQAAALLAVTSALDAILALPSAAAPGRRSLLGLAG